MGSVGGPRKVGDSGEEGVLSGEAGAWFPPESLEGDHLKCRESFLLPQVLNYKSHVGQGFVKDHENLNIGNLSLLS